MGLPTPHCRRIAGRPALALHRDDDSSEGWQLGGAIYPETYGYDPSLYADYFLGHHTPSGGLTFTPYVGQALIPNTDYVITFATPQFATVSASILYISGRDENFYEWSSADIGNTSLTINWRPTDKLRWGVTYSANLYHRHSDGSLVESQFIPRLDLEYQVSRPIFLRLIGQYNAVYQDSLRDDSRTDLPIYYRDATTGATRAPRRSPPISSRCRDCSPTSPFLARWHSSAMATT